MRALAAPRIRFAAALSALACLAFLSPAANAIWLTGSIAASSTDGGSAQIDFTCQGENPCRGTYVALFQDGGCQGGAIDTVVITGLDLSRSGTVSGTATFANFMDRGESRWPDGSCHHSNGPFPSFSTTFTGTWNGSSAQLAFAPPAGVTMSGSARVMSRLAKVSGSVSGSGPAGSANISFSCEGETPCVGSGTATFRESGCSNSFTFTERIGFTGLNLTQPGAISGIVLLRQGDYSVVQNADGTCAFSLRFGLDGGSQYSGSSGGSAGTLTLLGQDFSASGSFTATFETLPTSTRPPVFEMTVTSSITPTVSSATANIQYRPADVGQSGSVYTFAVAPRTLVSTGAESALVLGKTAPGKASGDDAPVACVLAQLNGSGQLQGVSASALQSYLSGVLSSQGQAVKVIDGVATANIAGATFYVGYGASATAMMSGGVNRNVITVPGTQVCQPKPPQTGWWWNAAEDGRGYTIESTGDKLFFAAYLYDVSGRSTWYIAAGPTSIDGSLFVGNLESYTNGQSLSGAFRSPVRPPVLNGQVTLAFNDEHHGTLIWPGGTVAIDRMEWGVGGVNAVPQANQPENGWWLSGLDDGRGFFIEWQAGIGFMAGFMYDDAGAPVWYIAANPLSANAQVFSSNWEQYTNGQTLTGTYRPPNRPPTLVGPATIQFSGPANAVMTMPGGRQVTLTRYRF
ncbi:MAG: hypothetical protein FIB05_06595 [Betaproteobacteria bacterium]|nr:hypothetical protein [Betaproteobacteria bacterium]